ncbi:hypothetical protein [Halorarum salinum]|uniref:Uncharacterized protein n=1 Tax=Halorarum salinum TaxID=2743089 RepID=A0A7D5QGE3_9EURY|nr:hypothetical protein [Halobaculum salinum]QLG61982.1 hypothetical protein HUG12_09715 [Halobaculum salinum]
MEGGTVEDYIERIETYLDAFDYAQTEVDVTVSAYDSLCGTGVEPALRVGVRDRTASRPKRSGVFEAEVSWSAVYAEAARRDAVYEQVLEEVSETFSDLYVFSSDQ